ncbi:hypothetical protein B9S53_20810 [Arthrospira sp. O9.13F]|nr:hypothetical protein B9S53_20810 [Arthrospira sp. O9.13F]
MIGFYHEESDLMSMSSGKFGMVWGLTVYSLLSCESLGVLYLIVLRCKANLGLNSGSAAAYKNHSTKQLRILQLPCKYPFKLFHIL